MAGNPQQQQSPFRRYWWGTLIALFLIALCCGVAGGAFGRDIVDRVVGNPPGTEAATEPPTVPSVKIPTDSPTATDIVINTEAAATATDTPTATATATATSAVTCRCQGPDLVCSSGATIKNSPRCPTPIPPTKTPAPAACTPGWKPASGCTCCGYDLYCADGSVGIFNPQCACKCQGTTLVCADGGSIPNAKQCGGTP